MHRQALSILAFALLTNGAFSQATYDARIVEYAGLDYACDGEVTPVLKIINDGTASMSGCVVDTWKNGIMVNSFDWQLAVPSVQGEVRGPALPTVPVLPGDVLEFRIMTVNTFPDEVTEGNILAKDMVGVPASTTSNSVTVELLTDNDPGDLTWEIRNALNVVIGSGGPYVDANTLITEDVTLGPDACFSFKADDAGRGGGSLARFNVKANGNTLITAEGSDLAGGYSKGLRTGNGGVCTEQISMEVGTDGAPEQTRWEVIDQGTGAVVCASSGAYPVNGTIMEGCCLAEGCYRLVVSDLGGDGIAGGGYVLRAPDGSRIIDDRNNFNSGATSAIADNSGFCLPLGDTRLITTSCEKYYWRNGEFVVVNEDVDVANEWIPNAPNAAQSPSTGYDFWFFDPNGGYSFVRQRRHDVSDGFASVGSTRTCHMQVNHWSAANHIEDQRPLNVRVRAVVNGVPKEWGPACRFVRDEALAQCPPTKLVDAPNSPWFSCNVHRDFIAGAANRLYARPVRGATRYRFTFSNSETTIVREVNKYFLNLGWGLGAAAPLTPGSTYDVTVEAFKGGAYCPAGEICSVTINVLVNGGEERMSVAGPDDEASFEVYPNPNQGDRLFIVLEAEDEDVDVDQALITIRDLSGKRMMERSFPISFGELRTILELDGDLAPGMYLVSARIGGTLRSQRLVVQR